MLLRQRGLPVTLIHATDGVRALDHLDIGDRTELYLAFKAIFVGRPEEVPVFDRCFDAFWRAAPAEEGIPGLIQVPPAEAPEWARGPQTDAPGQPDARRPDRAALPRAEAQEGPARPALRHLGVDGPLQPLPAPVSFCAPERLRPGRDVHVLDAPHAHHRAPARSRLPAGPASAHRGARLVGRDEDRRVARSVQPRIAEARGPADDRDHPL